VPRSDEHLGRLNEKRKVFVKMRGVFDNGMLQWSVIYEANHAILTVEQHVPDQGSTFLLLTLGLLGLAMYRRQLPKQA
jgi:hypothetical protein